MLITTTIIQSGIDIPNVNTLVVFNSDELGLSQLYQIRGRIGRSKSQGFSYFCLSKKIDIHSNAFKRLQILQKLENLKGKELKGSKRIELGLADDIKKQAQKLESAINKFGSDKSKQLFKDLSKKVKDLADKTRDEVDSNYTKIYKEVNGLTPLMEKFIVASKELGVEEILKQPVFNNDLIEKADDENVMSSKLVKRIREDYL